jgi:hypothetical protein
MFAAGGWRALSGVRVWGEGDPPAARVSWELFQFGGQLAVELSYHLGNELISDIVPLELASTAPHRRKRFYFRCPDCGRRVAKLYRPIIWWAAPPVRRMFRCRHCHRLGYQSQLGISAGARWGLALLARRQGE